MGAIQVHGVDGAVPAVSPVDPLVHPVIGNTLRIDLILQDDCVVFGGSPGIHPANQSLRLDLSEEQLSILVIKINSDHIAHVDNWVERHLRSLTGDIDGDELGPNLSSGGEHNVLIRHLAPATIRGQHSRGTVTLVLSVRVGAGEAELLTATVAIPGAARVA